MVASTFETVLLLFAVLVVVALAARRFDTAPSILLVVAGVALALMPGLPRVELAPELVLLGILPPLIYSAGVQMSWREFRFNLRPITLLAFGAVLFTTGAVAWAVHELIGLPWAIGFLLGAIVAPPDVIAPLTIARRLRLPRRLLLVLEGEGLANDATALILYRFAVVAITTGAFSIGEAAATFAVIVVGEIAYGIGVGWLSLRLRQWAADPRVEITLSLMTPYLAYWVPEHLGGSGVLATVAAGLYVSWRGPLLIPSATRLQGIFFWDLLVYLIEGLVFLLTGLQARTLLERLATVPMQEVLFAALVTTGIVIAARFVWVFPAVYLPRLIPSLRRRDPAPPWTWAFLLAFVGVRGVVSLAAALAIPFTLADGSPFPYRDLILFITFFVIVVTLIVQGLLLPRVIGLLRLARHAHEEEKRERQAELAARSEALQAVRRKLDEFAAARKLPDEVLGQLRARHDQRVRQLPRTSDESHATLKLAAEARMQLIALEREFLFGLLREGRITDESRRRIERELDLEEASISCKTGGGADLPV
jgi:CPA1 family monovalent cation:H+ antiporter